MCTTDNTIKIKKGLDIPLEGDAAPIVADARHIDTYALQPSDFVGLVPKLLVGEGDTVQAGTPLFCDKHDPRILFPSPVSGTVKSIVRGEKRSLLAVVVQKTAPVPEFVEGHPSSLNPHNSALSPWHLLRQRPFGTVAQPDSHPKAIFISCFDTAPLASSVDFLLQGREQDFLAGLQYLTQLTPAPIHLAFTPGQTLARRIAQNDRILVHYFQGPHPAGNVGTQIAALDPINKGEVVWTVGPQEVAILGHWARTGEYCPERIVAFAGSSAKYPQHYRVITGACVEPLICAQQFNPDYPRLQTSREAAVRYISGNVLTGTTLTAGGFLHFYDSLITALPEGNYYDFLGWLLPGLRKFSVSRTFLSGCLTHFCTLFLHHAHISPQPSTLNSQLIIDTSLHGDQRPFVLSGQFDRLFPFDIYPLQLIKAAIIGDIELMEQLGIYEVEPEDFALCEFADVSKTDIQSIIRNALELCRKEAL